MEGSKENRARYRVSRRVDIPSGPKIVPASEIEMKNTAAYVVLVLCAGLLSAEKSATKILVVYYSPAGHTAAMAASIAAGAVSVEGVVVALETVESVGLNQVLEADAIIIGSPVLNANVAPEVQKFINGWPIEETPLRNKVGAAFATGGGISAGEEAVQFSILRSMLIFGMVVVGGPEWTSPFGASAITEEAPFDPQDGKQLVAEMFLRKGRDLGKRIAELALRWKQNAASEETRRAKP